MPVWCWLHLPFRMWFTVSPPAPTLNGPTSQPVRNSRLLISFQYYYCQPNNGAAVIILGPESIFSTFQTEYIYIICKTVRFYVRRNYEYILLRVICYYEWVTTHSRLHRSVQCLMFSDAWMIEVCLLCPRTILSIDWCTPILVQLFQFRPSGEWHVCGHSKAFNFYCVFCDHIFRTFNESPSSGWAIEH